MGSDVSDRGGAGGPDAGRNGSDRSSAGRDGTGRDSAGKDSAGKDSAGKDSGGRDSRQSSDPVGDFQRWLMKAGARSLGREVAGRVRTTVTGGRRTSGDVWETATTEPPPDEAPECAWCPICRAARRYRDAGNASASTGLGSQLAGVTDTLAGLAQDAFGIFDAALRSQQRPAGQPSKPAGSGTGWPGATSIADAAVDKDNGSAGGADSGGADSGGAGSGGAGSGGADSGGAGSDNGPVVGTAVPGGAAVHPQDQDSKAADEGGDRDERGEAGDGPAARGGDDQVEGSAD